MSVQIGQFRFRYSGFYVDPARPHFGSGEWLTEDVCRTVVAHMLVDAASCQPLAVALIAAVIQAFWRSPMKKPHQVVSVNVEAALRYRRYITLAEIGTEAQTDIL